MLASPRWVTTALVLMGILTSALVTFFVARNAQEIKEMLSMDYHEMESHDRTKSLLQMGNLSCPKPIVAAVCEVCTKGFEIVGRILVIAVWKICWCGHAWRTASRHQRRYPSLTSSCPPYSIDWPGGKLHGINKFRPMYKQFRIYSGFKNISFTLASHTF